MPHDPTRTDFQLTPRGSAPASQPTSPRPRAHPAADLDTSDSHPFHILIMADLSGRDSRPDQPPAPTPFANRRPLRVDIDNLDAVLAQFAVQVNIPIGPATLPIAIRKLDDFHPDRLFDQLPIFTKLRDLHARLANPATFGAAAAEVRAMFTAPPPPPAPAATSSPSAPTQPGAPVPAPDITFASLLGMPPRPADSAAVSEAPADAFIRSIAAPYAVAAPDPDQSHLQHLVAEALAAGMRAVLHHPAFQAVEAAWRSVHFLVSRLNTDTGLKLFLLDATRDELAAALAAPELEDSPLHPILVDATVHTPGGIPWSLLIGDYTFDSSPESIRILAILATLAQAAGSPFIAAAASTLAGIPPGPDGPRSFAELPDPRQWHPAPPEDWTKLRTLPQTRWLALAAPRFLLRQPYGPSSDPAEKYNFTEIPPASNSAARAAELHNALLTANSAFAAASVIASAFLESEEPSPGEAWAVAPTDQLEISDLPAFTIDDEMTPCAEAYLTDSAAETMLAQGLLPILSIKRRPAIRLFGLPSLAADNAPLAGRWS